MQRLVSDFLEFTEDPVALIASDFSVIESNPAWKSRVIKAPEGATESQSTTSLWDMIHASDAMLLKAAFEALGRDSQSGRVLHVEAHLASPQYSDLIYRWSMRWNADRTGVVMIGRDVTEFRVYQSRYHEIEVTAQLGVWEVDLNRGHVWWSDLMHRIHGTLPGIYDPSVEDTMQFYHPDHRLEIASAVERMLREGEPYDLRLKVVRADGKELWVRTKSRVEKVRNKVVKCFGTVQDITNEVELELRDKAQAEQFQAIAQNIPVMIGLYNANGSFEWVNRQWEVELGYTLDQMANKDMLALFYPDPDIRADAIQFMSSQEQAWRDFKTRTHSGEDIEITWANVPLSNGKTIGIGKNLTWRKKLEEDLKQLNSQLQLALDVGRLGVLEFYPIESRASFSEGWCRMLGLEKDQVDARITAWRRLIHPDDAESTLSAFEKCVHGELDRFEVSHRLRHSDGSWRWIQCWGKVTERDSSQRAVRFMAVSVDATRMHQAEREAERYFNSSLTLHAVCGLDGRFRRVNPAFTESLGWLPEELTEVPFLEFVHPDDKAKTEAQFKKLLEGQNAFRFENRYRTKSGDFRILSWVSRAVQNDDLIYAAAQDVTEARESELKMFQSSRLASLGEMASGIAHEINNPLAIIRARTEHVRSLIESGETDRAATEISRIESTVDRIANIIRGLRTLSRDSLLDPMEPVSLTSVVDDALELARERIRVSGVQLEVDGQKLAQLPRINGRPAQIGQVVLNLLSNAYDAVGPLEEKWIKISGDCVNDRVELRITDSGAGIPSEIESKMMQPFFTTKGVGKGTGLGLSISQSILREHGGQLKYDRGSDRTSFVIELPATV